LTSPTSDRTSDSLFATAISFELAVGFGGLLLGLFLGPDAREYVPEWFEYPVIGSAIAWGTVAALPLTIAVSLLSFLPLKSIRDLHQLAQRQLMPMFSSFSWIQLILTAIAAGICEELLFRGWLQCWLSGPIDPTAPWQPQVVLAVVLAGVAFGICHSLTPMYFVLATLAGIYFGVLLVETTNLLIPITAHAVYDILMFIRLRKLSLRGEQTAKQTAK